MDIKTKIETYLDEMDAGHEDYYEGIEKKNKLNKLKSDMKYLEKQKNKIENEKNRNIEDDEEYESIVDEIKEIGVKIKKLNKTNSMERM